MKSLVLTWQGSQNQEVVYPNCRLREETSKVTSGSRHGTKLLMSSRVVKDRKARAHCSIEDDATAAASPEYVSAPFAIDRNMLSSPHYRRLGEWITAAINMVKS